MKNRLIALLLSLLMLASLAACGGKAEKEVDLSEFYATLNSGEDAPPMMELDEEQWEAFYPGLTAIARKQTVVNIAAMSAVAREIVLVQVEKSGDVQAVKDILQARIDAQVAGGAWYPETVESWQKNSEIVSEGSYVALFVGTDKAELVQSFRDLF